VPHGECRRRNYQLLPGSQKRWRWLNGSELIPKIRYRRPFSSTVKNQGNKPA
jgi:hypothetical protein